MVEPTFLKTIKPQVVLTVVQDTFHTVKVAHTALRGLKLKVTQGRGRGDPGYVTKLTIVVHMWC